MKVNDGKKRMDDDSDDDYDQPVQQKKQEPEVNLLDINESSQPADLFGGGNIDLMGGGLLDLGSSDTPAQ